jgi:hypothetical protein
MTDESGHNWRRRWTPPVVCAVLLMAFAAISGSAVLTKSATADEPLHAMGAYMRLFHGDFRLNPEDPPLFGYWAMLPHRPNSVSVDTQSYQWQNTLDYLWRQWDFCTVTLYHTPGNDPDAFIARSRVAMVALGLALGVVLACWAWKLAGPVAAVTATVLYALDPNFLGHAPLIKNDVPMTLVLLAVMLACWSVGRRAAWWKVLLLAVLCAAAVNTKFSGLIVGPVVGVALVARALLKRPWLVMGRVLTSRWRKLLLVTMIGVACVGSSVAGIWACYGFRYAPTPDPAARMNMPLIVHAAATARELSETLKRGESPSPQELDSYYHTPFIRLVLFAERHHMLPQAWLAGLLDTHATTMKRSSYLNGQIGRLGWWYYFPLAMLYKTPTATLAAATLALACALVFRRKGGVGLDRWSLVCLVVPFVIYGAAALRSQLNLGLRHVFPLYPLLFLLVAVTVARLASKLPRTTALIGGLLGIGLAVESLAAWPNYIAFFNAPSGGAIGGFKRLGDSNLDWGQDLYLLKQWQARHPDTRLYLSYFGGADPRYYVRFHPLPGNIGLAAPLEPPTAPGVFAVSATNLQGMYLKPLELAIYRQLMATQRPIEVLGGTIYLYEFPGAPATRGVP